MTNLESTNKENELNPETGEERNVILQMLLGERKDVLSL